MHSASWLSPVVTNKKKTFYRTICSLTPLCCQPPACGKNCRGRGCRSSSSLRRCCPRWSRTQPCPGLAWLLQAQNLLRSEIRKKYISHLRIDFTLFFCSYKYISYTFLLSSVKKNKYAVNKTTTLRQIETISHTDCQIHLSVTFQFLHYTGQINGL